jgi:hypothetical protein
MAEKKEESEAREEEMKVHLFSLYDNPTLSATRIPSQYTHGRYIRICNALRTPLILSALH